MFGTKAIKDWMVSWLERVRKDKNQQNHFIAIVANPHWTNLAS